MCVCAEASFTWLFLLESGAYTCAEGGERVPEGSLKPSYEDTPEETTDANRNKTAVG